MSVPAVARRRRAATLVALGLALTPASLRAQSSGQSPLSPLLEVIALDRNLLAIDSEGGGEKSLRLELGEQLVWSRSKGRIGVAVTDRRMLAVATLSGSWQQVRYMDGEEIPEEALMGDRVALILTNKRALGFDSVNRNLFEYRIGPNEQWSETSVAANVVVVLTNRLALGLAAGPAGFRNASLRIGESIEHLEAFANHVSLVTPARLLIFRASSGSWEEQRRRLR
jgi:hypothetical protein